MTDADRIEEILAELERLDAEATKGPWSATGPNEKNDVCLFAGNGEWLANVGNWARGQDPFTYTQPETIETEHVANAALIAARNALPVLLKLARLALRARMLVDPQYADYPDTLNSHARWMAELDALLAPTQREGGG